MTHVVSVQQTQVVAVSDTEIEVITVGTQGPAGVGVPAGGTTRQALVKASDANYDVEWGEATESERIQQVQVLGESASAYRMVYADLDGKVYLASSDDVLTAKSIRGISIQAGSEDDEVIVVSEGEVTNSSWNWSGNQNLYLGVGGVISNTRPITGYLVRVGYSVAPDKMYVRIGSVILLN
jgi:hypothetical protein